MHSTKRLTTKEFIKRAKEIHGDKYDYSKVDYVNNRTKVCIICPKHGEFWQCPKQHFRGQGCPECGKFAKREHKKIKPRGKLYTNEEFISILKNIYGNKYDYSKVDYHGIHKPVTLICQKHGEFTKTGNALINKKSGCSKCNLEKRNKNSSLGRELFVKRANDVFHNHFDYSNVIYKNNSTKVDIICPKHGSFFCTPNNHLAGRGCPICKSETYVYEDRLYNFLKTFIEEKEIIRQYRDKWLSNNKSLDFYIPKYKIAIEHQGGQHFYKMNYKKIGEEKLKRQRFNDKVKIQECEQNGVNLLFYTYELRCKPSNCWYELLRDEKQLKNKILNIISKNE